MSKKERVALVTGASRGIGRAIALELAQHGAAVAINDLPGQRERAEEVIREIEKGGSKALFAQADITRPDQVDAMINQVVSQLGNIHVMVNNAGIVRDNLLMRLPEEDWDAVVNTNLKGAFLCTRAAIRPMIRQRWGRIISISSVVGIMGNPGQTNYAASKAGLLGFTKSLAKEVASRNITVNAVAPGYIATDIVDVLSDRLKSHILARIPISRFGAAEDVAHVVAFLASEEASYITGQVIGVDGGLGMS